MSRKHGPLSRSWQLAKIPTSQLCFMAWQLVGRMAQICFRSGGEVGHTSTEGAWILALAQRAQIFCSGKFPLLFRNASIRQCSHHKRTKRCWHPVRIPTRAVVDLLRFRDAEKKEFLCGAIRAARLFRRSFGASNQVAWAASEAPDILRITLPPPWKKEPECYSHLAALLPYVAVRLDISDAFLPIFSWRHGSSS